MSAWADFGSVAETLSMAFYLTGAALFLHTWWWGAGLALALTPRYWRRCWIIFAPVCGLALQSAVVWVGALVDLPGTQSYAAWSELLPAVLLGWQVANHGWATLGRAWRATVGIWVLALLALGVLLWPLAKASPELTTISIGSCDAADYAAGARLMQEFRRSDREGFLGLTEVVQLHSVDDFYEHFIRLNHFAPSALVAHHAAVFRLAPHQLIGTFTAVLLASSLPLVFWLARATLGLRRAPALLVAGLYGFSPVTWYAVYHVAMGQLIAAQAITLLTIGGVALWRRRAHPSRAGGWAGLLAMGYGLIFAGYHFIILVALVPAAAFAFGDVLRRRSLATLARWDWRMTAPGVAAAAFYWLRVDGLLERFALFESSNFGWPIRALSPEGWLGFVDGPTFTPLPAALRFALLALIGLALVWTFRNWSWASARDWLGFSLTVPPLGGYLYLLWEGRIPGSHASYDAYKILSVFFPGILAVSCAWLTLWRERALVRGVVIILVASVVGAHAVSADAYLTRAARPQLLVDADLAALQELEARAEVESINVLLPDMWSRLWANTFLLRRPQYFAQPTYEGRQPTELKGAWDLSSGLIQVRPAPGAESGDVIAIGDRFQLRRRGGTADLRTEWGPQWFDLERNPRTGDRWRWAGADAEVRVDNRTGVPRRVRLDLEAWSVIPRDVRLFVDGRPLEGGSLDVRPTPVGFPPLVLPPGTTALRFSSPTPAVQPSGQDSRLLLLAVRRLTVTMLPGATAPTEAAPVACP